MIRRTEAFDPAHETCGRSSKQRRHRRGGRQREHTTIGPLTGSSCTPALWGPHTFLSHACKSRRCSGKTKRRTCPAPLAGADATILVGSWGLYPRRRETHERHDGNIDSSGSTILRAAVTTALGLGRWEASLAPTLRAASGLGSRRRTTLRDRPTPHRHSSAAERPRAAADLGLHSG